jgi:hypothetical protein
VFNEILIFAEYVTAWKKVELSAMTAASSYSADVFAENAFIIFTQIHRRYCQRLRHLQQRSVYSQSLDSLGLERAFWLLL